MEYGNYGYRDEITGASWSSRRTNWEKEIPLRHWHLNDPGVVPNVLQTGAGSPSGLTIYEGDLLPKEFYGQMIHAEPGNNVVRSYPVENDGAGYKASIVKILEAQKDQWFRPIDVAVAPDGSLFVADWYDPGVGGHQVGDINRGRIYRVAPPKHPYKIDAMDLSTPEGAIEALLNPNSARRFLGWQSLAASAENAEGALVKIWHSENPRHRAQALWLLAMLKAGDHYIGEALADKDANIRIAGIRADRLGHQIPLIDVATRLIKDESSQVRRELALALRGDNTVEAARLWTALAEQYDGKDRWYLEALGISATDNWDLYFNTWKTKVGSDWKKPANRDIVWRSRSKFAIPMIAELIKESNDTEMLRYYRSLDFQTDPSKQVMLAQLVQQTKGAKVLYALKHMDASKLKMTPPIREALNKVLADEKGKIEFVELVSSFKLQDRSGELLHMALQYPDSLTGREAMRTLLAWDKTNLIGEALKSKNGTEPQSAIRALRSQMYNPKAIALVESVMMDSTRDIELRKVAVKNFGGPWQAEDRLLALAKEKKIPASLHTAAAGVFQSAWRAKLRDEAAAYLTLPGSKSGTPLPPISALVDQKGDPVKGKEVFTAMCSTCHRVNGEGTNFGPDLSGIGDKLSRDALYTSILFPDQGISFGFEGYKLTLNDGTTAVGRIVSETPDKVDLQYMANQQTVQKAAITSRVKLDSSLMPSNLQSNMTEEEIVNLVQYLSLLKDEARITAR